MYWWLKSTTRAVQYGKDELQHRFFSHMPSFFILNTNCLFNLITFLIKLVIVTWESQVKCCGLTHNTAQHFLLVLKNWAFFVSLCILYCWILDVDSFKMVFFVPQIWVSTQNSNYSSRLKFLFCQFLEISIVVMLILGGNLFKTLRT